ncbi:hypothetical protein C8Q80DRAFT_1267759 [Daedaleopsis nitida]|nr:hypothetical protein C8Q80DRAFT_1267759 [Daedaleopsis nitida]
MRKRAPSPPPHNDSLFFTVVNPYPDQPHQSPEDSKMFSRWIACIVGADRLHAFYHKPKSANMVIIEVRQDVDLRRLLGAHRWAEILRNPHPEDKDEVSSIFRCTKTSDHAMEKETWVRRDVEEAWFRKWSPATDDTVAYPYPTSHFCLPPAEDRMRLPLCRPIPQDFFRQHKADTILAAVPCNISCPPRVSQGYRSTHGSESSDLSADELLNPVASLRHYVPAIHGADTPKGNAVVAVSAGPADRALWLGYGDSSDSDPEKLCAVHGPLCSSGICRLRGQEKRAARLETRAKQRDEERLARDTQRQRMQDDSRGGNPTTRSTSVSRRTEVSPPKRRSAGESASEEEAKASREDRASRLRPDIKVIYAKGKGRLGRFGASYASAANSTNATRTLPAHLRRSEIDSTAKSDSSESEDGIGRPGGRLMHAQRPASQPAALIRTPGAGCASPGTPSPASYRSSFGPRPASPASSSSSLSLPSPPSPPPAWHAYAKVPGVRSDDELSVVTDATNDAFGNPWKHVQPMQAAPPRWTDVGSGVAQLNAETSASRRVEANYRPQSEHQDYYEDEEDEFALECVGPVKVCDVDGEDYAGSEDMMSNVSDYTDEPF